MWKLILILTTLITSELCENLTQYFQNDYILISERMELIYYNNNYMKKAQIKNFKYNRTHFGLNITGIWKVDVYGPLIMTVQAYRFASNEYRLFPIYFPFDVCDILQRDIFGMQNMYKCGNMFRCPIKKGHYHLCNWGPDYTKFPPRAPRGRYMFAMDLKNKETSLAKYEWYIAIEDIPLKY